MSILIKSLQRLKIIVDHRQSFNIFRSYSFTFNEQFTYNEQNYMRKVLKRTSGCILFDPSKNLKYLVSPKEFSEGNQTMFNLVSAVKKVNTHHRSDLEYSQKLLAPLNDQCLENYKAWPINEQLFALDVWHFVRGGKDFPFFEAVLTNFLKAFYGLEDGPALQTMYYVARSKRQLQPNEEVVVTKKLEEIISSLTLDEISIYCLALVKSGCQVDSVSLVKSLYESLMKSDLRHHDDIGVTGVVKAVRRFSTTDQLPELKDLQNKLVPFAEQASLLALTHIIQLGAKQRVFNAQLIDVIIRRFLQNLDNLRIKDVERALLAISTFNHKTNNGIDKQFCDQAQVYLLMSLDTKFADSLIRCISYLAVFGVVDARLIDWALSPEVHAHVYGESISADEHALLLIDSYAKINLAHTYTGNRLPESLCAELMLKVCEAEVAGQKSELANEISDVLRTNGIHCISSRPIPHVPFPDIFLVYNKRTHKAISILNANADGTILDANSLYKNNPNLEAIAIIPCLQRQLVFNTNRYNGQFQLRLDQLRMLGFKTIVIKKTIWNCYKSPEAKRRYLALELCRNDVFLLNKVVNFVFKSKPGE
ncbi:uncharacterized protein LOC129567869 [Sitodiplosis mosellana]|uniref:uncharacterized protein LOC129567869 n=1 Tax=Sitodiplosis mosellana TaxID=263140 RepID=UPI0024439737|nr:uncharacterized protein LOC129567869 [Sitodiplosis mosellana]